jgi:hypothetical protein
MIRGFALKVTYNDGEAGEGGLIGYRGVCSLPTILENVKIRGMTNCRREDGLCRKFIEGGMIGSPPTLKGNNPWCYESTLLSVSPWRFGAGMYHNGPKAGQPIPVKNIQPGDFAFLTTIAPGSTDSHRFVFALFKVGSVDLDENWGHMITSDGTCQIQLSDDVARSVLYWDFNSNSDGSKQWGSGLVRYLNEKNVESLIARILGQLGTMKDRDTLYESVGKSIAPAITTRSGFGFGGGEGEEHKRLKHLVANSPELIGLPTHAIPKIEHDFKSGDRVDICFDLGEKSVVVEIETVVTLPGAHQCIKYRALREAELGYPIDSGLVDATLVAHSFDTETIRLARDYAIKLVVLQPQTLPLALENNHDRPVPYEP